MFAESSQVTVLRGGGPGIFPPNAREGDADEQPRGGGGDGRHRGDGRCEGPLVDGSPPLGCRDKSGGCRAPKPELGRWPRPSLPPERAEGPAVHRTFWSSASCAALVGKGLPPPAPGTQRLLEAHAMCLSPVSQGWCRHQGSPQETLLLWSLLSFHRKGNQLLEMV